MSLSIAGGLLTPFTSSPAGAAGRPRAWRTHEIRMTGRASRRLQGNVFIARSESRRMKTVNPVLVPNFHFVRSRDLVSSLNHGHEVAQHWPRKSPLTAKAGRYIPGRARGRQNCLPLDNIH